jgi:CHASE2 domain-containing sensor protein
MFRRWMRTLVTRLSARPYVRAAILDEADLSAFRERPTVRVIAGVALILFSYVVAWPLISVLGAASLYLRQPLIVAIGGPAAYGLSHLIFILGMYLSGAKYTAIFLRWATRMAVVRLQRRYPPPPKSSSEA